MIPKMRMSAINVTILTGMLGVLTSAQAVVTVHVSSGLGDPSFVSVTSAPVDGAIVELGVFDDGYDVVANAASPLDFGGAWHSFGATSTITISGEAGHVGGSVSNANAFFDNKRIHAWVKLPATGAYALLTSAQANWIIPAQGSAVSSTLVSTSEITTLFHGQFDVAGDVVLAQAIPEPGTGFLCLMALATLAARRRREFSC